MIHAWFRVVECTFVVSTSSVSLPTSFSSSNIGTPTETISAALSLSSSASSSSSSSNHPHQSTTSSCVPPNANLQIFAPASMQHSFPHILTSASVPGQPFSAAHANVQSEFSTYLVFKLDKATLCVSVRASIRHCVIVSD